MNFCQCDKQISPYCRLQFVENGRLIRLARAAFPSKKGSENYRFKFRSTILFRGFYFKVVAFLQGIKLSAKLLTLANRQYLLQHFNFLFQSLTITGFNIYKYANDFYDSLNELSDWCTSGKIHPYENVVEGFENMPKALIDQLDGKSQGKAILRV